MFGGFATAAAPPILRSAEARAARPRKEETPTTATSRILPLKAFAARARHVCRPESSQHGSCVSILVALFVIVIYPFLQVSSIDNYNIDVSKCTPRCVHGSSGERCVIEEFSRSVVKLASRLSSANTYFRPSPRINKV